MKPCQTRFTITSTLVVTTLVVATLAIAIAARRDVRPATGADPVSVSTAATVTDAHPGSLARAEDGAPAANELTLVKRRLDSIDADLVARATRTAVEISELRRELARLRDEAAVPSVAADEVEVGDLDERRRERLADTEATFWREPEDRSWSDKATAAVLDALDTPDTDALEVLDLACRARTCRIELAAIAGEATTMLPVFLSRLGQTLPNVTAAEVENPDGTHGTVIFATADEEERGDSGGARSARG